MKSQNLIATIEEDGRNNKRFIAVIRFKLNIYGTKLTTEGQLFWILLACNLFRTKLTRIYWWQDKWFVFLYLSVFNPFSRKLWDGYALKTWKNGKDISSFAITSNVISWQDAGDLYLLSEKRNCLLLYLHFSVLK